MSESPTTPETEADPRDARAARRLAMLERLAEIGMALATDLGRRVEEALERGEPLDGAAVALEFSRVSRAVRQTVALEARLDQDREALARMFQAERQAKGQALAKARAERIEARKDAAREAVTEAIDRSGAGKGRIERLWEALEDRLEDPREDDDFADLPLSVLIGRICAGLGVTADWDLWKNTDWAADEWRSGPSSSPYAPMTVDGLPETIALRASPPPRRWSG